MFIEGLVVKGVGGFYRVLDGSGRGHVCRAAGRFRYENTTPLPGDWVAFIAGDDGQDGFIDRIMPRKNVLVRPPVANITQLCVTVSVKNPCPDLILADKLIAQAIRSGIRPVLLINKTDIAPKEQTDAIAAQYENVCQWAAVSALTGEGMDALKMLLKDNVTCFAGQSAVGKSSVLGRITGRDLQTGGLGKKTQKGRHTTRHVELVFLPSLAGGVIDTPGFSLLDTPDDDPQALWRLYPDFAAFADGCRFATCIHESEPGCAVKRAASEGNIHAGRYERYLKILQEWKEKRNRKYD